MPEPVQAPAPPDLRFWRLRGVLWNAAYDHTAPFQRVYDDEIDYELERLMREAGVNALSVHDRRWTGLAEDGRVAALCPIFGTGYRPFRELRSFWLPFADAAATFYATVVDRQPNAEAMAREVEACRKALQAAFNKQDELLYRAWSKSPFRKTNADPIELYNQFDDKGCSALTALTSLEDFLKTMEPRLQNKADVWAWTFADVMARAFVRFTGTVPGTAQGSIKRFRRFVESAWAILSDDESLFRGDRAFRNVLTEGFTLGTRTRSFRDMLEVTDLALAAVIDQGPFEFHEKMTMKAAVCTAYMQAGDLPLLPRAEDEAARV